MSTTPGSDQGSQKPGMNCLLCRKRKLKCSREPSGCVHCRKSDLPCVYPEPEPSGVKKKRGPYRKDKAPREKHLEDLVKYLEPRTTGSSSTARLAGLQGTESSATWHHETASRSLGRSEDLVKDALTALTRSSAPEPDSGEGTAVSHPAEYPHTAVTSHTPASRIFEYWQIFLNRVDPLTKLVHAPTLAKRLFSSAPEARTVGQSTATLLTSIYFAAVTSCSDAECQRRFGQSRSELQRQYSGIIEAGLDNYGAPTLETVQAIILYIMTVRRSDINANMRALFALAVRMAQMIGLHEDPGSSFSPFERQIRRRLWWQLAGLESRSAEEGNARTTSILEGRNVQMPANVLDVDLNPNTDDDPVSRDGVTDMTFVLARLHIVALVHEVWKSRKRPGLSPTELRQTQDELFRTRKAQLDYNHLQHMHHSRPLDYMTAMISKAMLLKVRLLIDHPYGPIPTKQMSAEERLEILRASVEIINITHAVPMEPRLAEWFWYFRGYMQWHAFAVVVAELGYSKNSSFSESAWRVVGPILEHWDETYREKGDNSSWEHVNMLIQRAKHMRHNGGEARWTAEPVSQARAQPAPAPVQYTSIAHNSIGGPYYSSQAQTNSNIPMTADQMAQAYGSLNNMPLFGASTFDLSTNMDLGSLEDLENIDFGAFDAVFGNTWDFPMPEQALTSF